MVHVISLSGKEVVHIIAKYCGLCTESPFVKERKKIEIEAILLHQEITHCILTMSHYHNSADG